MTPIFSPCNEYIVPKKHISCMVIIWHTWSTRPGRVAILWLCNCRQTSNTSITSVGNIIVSLRCSWSIACRRYSNYIFIFDLAPGFNGLDKDNCMTRRYNSSFWIWCGLQCKFYGKYFVCSTKPSIIHEHIIAWLIDLSLQDRCRSDNRIACSHLRFLGSSDHTLGR